MKYKSLLFCAIALSAFVKAQKPLNLSNTGFYENKGQIVGQDYKANSGVKYLLCSPGFNVQLRQTGFSYDTYTDELTQPCPGGKTTSVANQSEQNRFKQSQVYTRHFHRVDIDLIGCNTDAEIVAEEKSYAYYNYITAGTPNGGVSDVHYYQKVIYKNIYPNIDLEFTTRTTTGAVPIEYNFIVHPGGNPSNIKLAYTGANCVKLDGNKLIVSVTAGDFTENIPISYFKNTKQVALVNYVATGKNTFGFSIPNSQLSALNSSSDLIIDPTPNLLWGTYYGGAGYDESEGITVDASNNVYIVGQTQNASNIATVGAYQVALAGGLNAFVAKFNSTGSALLWGTYYGGTSATVAYGIALDASNNVYITGYTNSPSGITTVGAYQTTNGGGYDAFAAKFNSTGTSLLWGTFYGGTGWEWGLAIAVDASNNAYITGYTQSTSGIASVGAYQTALAGTQNTFVAKINSTGSSLLWGTYYGGTGSDAGDGIKVDANNNVYVTGYTSSNTGIATVGAYQTAYGGNTQDAFVAKFNSTGTSLVWGTYYGGSGVDVSNGIALDATNNVYIAGYSGSLTGIATVGAYQTLGDATNWDAFVAKFNATGSSLLWGTYYGSASAEDVATGIAIDDSDNAYITGYTTSTTNIASVGAYQTAFAGGGWDAFVSKFNSTGTSLAWGTYYGTSNTEEGFGIALDANADVYVTGIAYGPSGLATVGAYQTTGSAGAGDVFVAEFVSCTAAPSQPGAIAGPTSVCNGSINTYKVAPVAGATTYTWVLPGGWIGSSTADSIIATAGVTNGIITVTADNGCGTSTVQSLDVTSCTTGINEVSTLDNEVKLYPNPFSQNVTVDVSVDGPVTITMFNMIGENIGQWQLNKGMNTINTGAMPSGVYLMQIKTANSILNKKLVKAN